jgi:hypothetical protein
MSDMARQSLGDKAGAALKMSLFSDLVDFSAFLDRQCNYLTFSFPLYLPGLPEDSSKRISFPDVRYQWLTCFSRIVGARKGRRSWQGRQRRLRRSAHRERESNTLRMPCDHNSAD